MVMEEDSAHLDGSWTYLRILWSAFQHAHWQIVFRGCHCQISPNRVISTESLTQVTVKRVFTPATPRLLRI